MRTQSWLATAALTAGLAVTPIPGTAQSHDKPSQEKQAQESVAEAARKAREQKKTQAKPAKVYTNDDLAKKAAGFPAGDAQEKGKAPAEGRDETPQKSAPAKDEAHWRGRFREARENLARAEKELDVLQRELQKADTQYYSDPTKAMNEQFSRKEINDKTAAVAAKRKEIADLRQALSDLEDELRHSGGDPGWAR